MIKGILIIVLVLFSMGLFVDSRAGDFEFASPILEMGLGSKCWNAVDFSGNHDCISSSPGPEGPGSYELFSNRTSGSRKRSQSGIKKSDTSVPFLRNLAYGALVGVGMWGTGELLYGDENPSIGMHVGFCAVLGVLVSGSQYIDAKK